MKRTSTYIPVKEIPYTLVIIDVQEGYTAAENENLLANLLKQIIQAKKDEAAILVVTMRNMSGRIINCIWQSVCDYKYYAEISKYDTDGSAMIVHAFRKYPFLNKNKFKVGGVYSNICVSHSVKGLAERLPDSEIEVLTKCCYTDWEDSTTAPMKDPFKYVKSEKNVQLIF
jgi:hypothetical protein